MTREEYKIICESTFKARMNLSDKKAKEYCLNEDPFDNFKRNGKALEVSQFLVWAVYAGKHWDSLITYVKGNKTLTEDIESRIDDLQNYLDLLRGMIIEMKEIGGGSP